MLFALAGQKFVDDRIEAAKWPELKPSTPFGQLPVLEVDGVKLCQSKTIERFLANKLGLAGKSDLEKAQADMIVDCLGDIRLPTVAVRRETDETKKAELRATYSKDTLPPYILMVEKLLKENKGGDGYFVGDSLTWADIAFTDLCCWIESNGMHLDLGPAPKLKALRQKVEGHPKIAEWIKNRPPSSF